VTHQVIEVTHQVIEALQNPAVPFANNVGERAVRVPKVKQKISSCFRTLAGAQYLCVILSCLDTLREQDHSMLVVLQRTFAGNPIPVSA
jgi:transposase